MSSSHDNGGIGSIFEGPPRKRRGRPRGALQNTEIKPYVAHKGPRIYTEEEKAIKSQQRQQNRVKKRLAEETVAEEEEKKEVEVMETAPTRSDVSRAFGPMPENRPTPEKRGYLHDVFGGDIGGIEDMDRTVLDVTYVATKFFERLHYGQRRRESTMQKRYVDFMKMQMEALCHGRGVLEIEQEMQRRMRRTVWHPARISQLQDSLVGCNLNMASIDALNVLTRKFKLDGVLNVIPSRANVQRWNRAFEDGIRKKVPSKMTKRSNFVCIDVERFISEMLEVSVYLQSRGRTQQQIDNGDLPVPIHLSGSCDGAKLTEHTGMLLCCLKIVDNGLLRELARARQSDTLGELDEVDVNLLPEYFNLQSLRNCVLVGWLEGTDNKQNTAKVGKHFFNFLEQLSEPDYYYQPENSELKYSFEITFPMDLKAHQITLGYGGGSAVTDHFCCFCPLQGAERGLPSLVPCIDCRLSNEVDGYCRHVDYLTTEMMAKMQEEIDFDDPLITKKLLIFPATADMKVAELKRFLIDVLMEDPNDVDKLNGTSMRNTIKSLERKYSINYFSVKALSDDDLDKLFLIKGIHTQEQQEQLIIQSQEVWSEMIHLNWNHREAKEYCMRFLSNEAMVIAAIKHRQEVAEDPIINKPELCIMCTLHMELRIGEYCLTELARELHNLEATTRNQKMEEMGSFIAGCFGGSRGVVEDDVEAGEQVHDFKVSMDKKNTKQIATIKMSAARQKKVMRHIDDLVDIVMTEQLMQQPGSVNTNAGYKILFQKYKMVLETMQRVDDIRNDPVAIAAVQKLLDDFSNHFHSMFGPTKVTNYIHALCSGHCRFWLRRYGNIAKYNNSGMEAYVGFARNYYFKRTSRGGFRNTSDPPPAVPAEDLVSVQGVGGGGPVIQHLNKDVPAVSTDAADLMPTLSRSVSFRQDHSGRIITTVQPAPSSISSSVNRNRIRVCVDMERMMLRSAGRLLASLSSNPAQYRYNATGTTSKTKNNKTKSTTTSVIDAVNDDTSMNIDQLETVAANSLINMQHNPTDDTQFGSATSTNMDLVNVFESDNLNESFLDDFDDHVDWNALNEHSETIDEDDDYMDTLIEILSESEDKSPSRDSLTSSLSRSPVSADRSIDTGNASSSRSNRGPRISTIWPLCDYSLIGYYEKRMYNEQIHGEEVIWQGKGSNRKRVKNNNCVLRSAMNIECSDDTCSNTLCCNRAIQRALPKKCMIANVWNVSNIRGNGLYCAELGGIPRGSYVGEYTGRVIKHSDAQSMLNRQKATGVVDFFLMYLGQYITNKRAHKLYIDPTPPFGNLTSFMNHSCKPNCEFQLWYVKGFPRVAVYTLQHIPEDEYLTVSYNVTYDSSFHLNCLCGNENCRGFV